MIIELPYKVTLRDYQKTPWNAFFTDQKKHLLLIYHRRAGKSKLAVNIIVAASQQRVGAYYYLFPQLKQARTAIWEGRGKDGIRFRDHFPACLIEHIDNAEMKITFKNGSIFRLLGTDQGSYDRLMGTNPIGVLYDEFAQHDPLARDYLLPILAENDGWEIIISTPRGHNHLYELKNNILGNDDWYYETLTVDDTQREDGSPVVNKESIEELKKAGWPQDKIDQEFYCSFEAAIRGAYFSHQLRAAEESGRIEDFPIDTKLPMHTFWDLGRRDPTAIWVVQIHRGEYRCIGYYENSMQDLTHYINWVRDFRNKHRLIEGKHFPPHDANYKTLASRGKSVREIALEYGFRFEPPVKQIDKKIAAIEMGRSIFGQCYFHKTNCERGLACLREYHSHYNEALGTYGDPVHNWSSHGADAFMTFAQALHENNLNSTQQALKLVRENILAGF